MAYLHGARESGPRHGAPWRGFMRNSFLELIARLPSDCALCQGQAQGGRLCPGCLADATRSMGSSQPRCKVCALALATGQGCPDCAVRKPAFDRIIAAFDYAPPGDLLIQHFKAGRRFAYARMLAGMLACQARLATPALSRHTILVPVPASRASIIKRGFNPAAEVARCLARQLQLACRPDLLLRVQEGAKQTRLNRAQRAMNTQILYACPQRLDQAAIAVVDDVLTTGSTLHSIALQFRAAGASSVCGLVLARTPCRQPL
jgi:ComF family protein